MEDEPGPSSLTSGGDVPMNSSVNAGDVSPTTAKTIDEADQPPATKQKDESRFRYGNYNRYYGTRVGGLDHDPRLDVLDADWFRNSAVLDIGCNVGALTLSVAKAYAPRRVLGIDIDAHLIGVARKNIRHYCDAGEEMAGKFPAALAKSKKENDVKVRKFPHNVWFQCENYVLADDYLIEMVRPEFDVILALSITKWIHLNWGDDGMRRFFRRAFRQLRPGGRLIVEPQAFATYGRRRKMADEMTENYRSIQFKPDQFTDYLLSAAVGFASVEELAAPAAKTKGFERPIFVYRKAVVREADERGGDSECEPPTRKRKRPSRKSKRKPTDANVGDNSAEPAVTSKEFHDEDDAEPRI